MYSFCILLLYSKYNYCRMNTFIIDHKTTCLTFVCDAYLKRPMNWCLRVPMSYNTIDSSPGENCFILVLINCLYYFDINVNNSSLELLVTEYLKGH